MRATVLVLALVACGNDIRVADTTEDPAVSFVVPVDGARFDPREPVLVCAKLSGGRDPLDVSLASDVDGVLATTADFTEGCAGGTLAFSATLSPTEHTLELAVTDANGRQARDSVTLVPTDDAAPGCVISAPGGETVLLGDAVDFEASIEDEFPASATLVLESSVAGELYAGGPNGRDLLELSLDLGAGEHTLTLHVTDVRGATGTCSAAVTVAECLDADLDGFDTCGEDCDDSDDGVAPDQEEIANGIDDDCDGAVDEGTALGDDDGDGFTEVDGDCDDADPDAFPGAPEVADDGVDQDCDGDDTVTCFQDDDEDGHGGSRTVLAADGECADAGESGLDDDCDDHDDTVFPGAFETLNDGVDQDCNGTDEVGCYADDDDDGFGSATILPSPDGDCLDAGETADGGDCADRDDTRYPGAAEVADDGIDQDCNGADTVRCRVDDDLDGFGTTAIRLAPDGDCDDPGEATTTSDCDDDDGAVYPGASETPDDGVDQDCSGTDARTCQLDQDFDTYGTAATTVSADADCTDPGEADDDDDCNDVLGTVFPFAPEVADDGIDQNCNGADTVTCRNDGDGDGYGSPATVYSDDGDCTDGGEAPDPDDCDDFDAGRNPGEVEIPGDGIDQDCTGADLVECWTDADRDAFGDDSLPTIPAADGDCLDAGESAIAGDCDDGDPAVNPAAPDAWGDGDDTDCDGADGADLDGDGFAAAFSGGPDCDDDDPAVNPGATEARNAIDDDCDASCDEGLVGPGDLVITELMINPDAVADDQGEYFEVKNVTGVDLPLCSGWTFSDGGTNTFTVADPTLVVRSGGYAVFAAQGNAGANGGVAEDYVFSPLLMQLGNGGDELTVTFDGVVIDAVTWSSAFDPTGASMQAKAGREDAGDNDVEGNWCAATTPLSGGDAGTPGAAPDCL